MALPPNSLRSLRSLCSNSGGKSDHEARCARGPRALRFSAPNRRPPTAWRAASTEQMDILYLLIPMSALLVLGILVLFAWALQAGQFDDLEQHGELILSDERGALDPHQAD